MLELQTQLQKQMKEVLERVADLEGEGPNGYTGGVPRQTKVDKGRWGTSVMDSKVVMSLGQLTDDKSAFRQWDLKLINALNYVRPGYGKALDRLKECIDRGTDPEDVRPGASSDWCDAHFGPLLVESLRGEQGERFGPAEVKQLDVDLEFILIDKAKPKSDILQRITNLQKHGGVRMYAEVYKWFTETSGQGLMEQTALMMNPKPATKEEDIAEAIEMWEEKVNRLARHGDDYKLSEALKKVALKNILVGKIKDNFELWESDRMPFEEILRRVKDQARTKKLENMPREDDRASASV